jgi:hypothetical protein
MKALFLNADASKQRCAIYQAGLIYSDAFKLCKELEITYAEISPGCKMPDPRPYDAVIFNYQHVSMSMLPPRYLDDCKKKIGFLYEARLYPLLSPTHFGNVACGAIFDHVITPDPTCESNRNVWSTGRVVPYSADCACKNDPPVIGTFGFPSPWKNLSGVVEMLNDEYEQATFQINFAPASHQEGTGLQEYMRQCVLDLTKLSKPGVNVMFTEEYMTDDALVDWLSKNDLNVFMASEERGRITGGALLASTDIAIAARKPILVSKTLEARHLEGLTANSIHAAIAENGKEVRRLHAEWSPANFARQIDQYVLAYL